MITFDSDNSIQLSVNAGTTLYDALIAAGETAANIAKISSWSLDIEDQDCRVSIGNTPTTDKGVRFFQDALYSIKGTAQEIYIIPVTGTAKINIIPGIAVANFNS